MSFISFIKSVSAASALYLLSACSQGQEVVILDTDLGLIEIEVYEDKAPISAADFLYYVDNGLYDGEGFYRSVLPQTDPRNMDMNIIQGGRLDVNRVSAEIALETTQMTGLTHHEGAVSIVRSATLDSGSAAYFSISIGENKFLDHGGARIADGQGLAVFGQVIKGMDTVRSIQSGDTFEAKDDGQLQDQYLVKPVIIKSARRK